MNMTEVILKICNICIGLVLMCACAFLLYRNHKLHNECNKLKDELSVTIKPPTMKSEQFNIVPVEAISEVYISENTTDAVVEDILNLAAEQCINDMMKQLNKCVLLTLVKEYSFDESFAKPLDKTTVLARLKILDQSDKIRDIPSLMEQYKRSCY